MLSWAWKKFYNLRACLLPDDVSKKNKLNWIVSSEDPDQTHGLGLQKLFAQVCV